MARNTDPGNRGALRWQRPAVSEPPAGGKLADGILLLSAAALGGITLGYLWHDYGPVLDWLDLASGMVACLALWWRRSHPVAVFLLAFGAAAFSPLALGAGLVAIGTVAARASGRVLILVVAISVAASIVFPLVNPSAGEILKVGFPAFLITVIAFGLGMYQRARRELVASLRERAEQLEADQERSAEQAREAERRRIAREMHDVLAHRLSLLSVHAGALEFHPGAPPAEIAKAATVIRTSATAALSDLRQVITVLREDTDGPPQPGFGQLADLVAESRAAGMNLHTDIDLSGTGPLPATLGRTVYRIVQEGLTNARKHAPGAPVQMRVTADAQVVVAEVVTGGPASGSPAAGSGAGLIGLAERVTLAGGNLTHGRNAIGDFVLRATIPGQP